MKMTILGMHLWTLTGVVLIAIGTIITIYGQSIGAENDKEDLKQAISNKDKEIDELVVGKNDLIEGNEALLSQNQKLLLGNNELIAKIDNFQRQIHEKDYKIIELEKKVKQAKFGVSKKYSYEGNISPNGAEGSIIVNDDAPGIFAKLTELEKNKTKEDLEEILKICNVQIKLKPDWYTLYLFKGMALAGLGQKNAAIKEFEFVIKNGPEEEKYLDPANFFLDNLRK